MIYNKSENFNKAITCGALRAIVKRRCAITRGALRAIAFNKYFFLILNNCISSRNDATPLLLLMFSIVVYLAISSTGNFNGDQLVSLATNLTNPERAGSLEFRFDNEELLGERARERILFGWGGWGRIIGHFFIPCFL